MRWIEVLLREFSGIWLAFRGYQQNEGRTTTSDDPTKRHPQDAKRIDVSEDWELRYWTQELGVDDQKLRESVKRICPMADDVRPALRRNQGNPLGISLITRDWAAVIYRNDHSRV